MRSFCSHLILKPLLCLGLAAGIASGQGDPLVSKTISHVFADQTGFWAFAGDGVHFSRIDPFTEPLDIRNGSLSAKYGIRGGVGREFSALLYFNSASADSTISGLTALDRSGKSPIDTLVFARAAGKTTQVTRGVEFSALALWNDTAIIGGGRAGFALSGTKKEGEGVLSGDSLVFLALAEDADTAAAVLRCAVNRVCPAEGMNGFNDDVGAPDSVSALAVTASSPDSAWLLIGTHAGLRRGLLSGNSFPKVFLPSSNTGPIRIERIHADAGNGILWVFSGSEYFFSDDHGLTFRKPVRGSGVNTDPAVLTGYNPSPMAANLGDTTFINFNLDNPGLVLFKRDTVLGNRGAGDFADIILDAGDGLDIERGQGRLTGMAAVRKGNESVLAAGSTFRGLYLRRPGTDAGGVWTNVNSLKALKDGLQEVITFPTLFSGTAPDGSPEYVNIGYRLKKSGNVTITVYNYAMEKVKTVVRNERREGGGGRSEKTGVDRWDGRDASGRHVSVGIYYILVETKDEKGWGKAIAVRGRGP